MEISLPGNSEWYNTGIAVTAGEHIIITASGQIYIGDVSAGEPNVSNYQTAAGDPNTTTSAQGNGFAAPGLVPWSLVGKIGNSGSPIEIGAGTTIAATTSGELYLSANDNNFGDNSGSWNVIISENNNTEISLSGADISVSYTVGGPAISIDPNLGISDTTATDLVGASVAISNGLLAGDRLNFTSQNGITGNFDSTSGVLTLTGTASVADYQTALDSVTFGSAAADPTANGTDKSRTVTWSVSDANGSSQPVTSTIDIQSPSQPTPAKFEEISGGGVLSQNGNSFTLDLGTLDAGANPLTIDLGVLNTSGSTDLLSGSFSISGDSAFSNSGLGSFSNIAAGQADAAPTVMLSADNVGTFAETVTLALTTTNGGGSSSALPAETLTITGSVEKLSIPSNGTIPLQPPGINGADTTGGTLQITSGTGSFTSISQENLTLDVSPGASLSGTVTLAADNLGPSSDVAPLIDTPSWGDPATSYQTINSWIPSGTSQQSASISLTAPTTPGTYHIIFAYEWEIGGDHVASATNYPLGYDVWTDGNEIAELNATQVAQAQSLGYTTNTWLFVTGYEPQFVPADAITVVVGGLTANQPPTIGDVGNTTTYTSGSAPVAIDSALTVSAGQATDITGATVTISSGYITGDTLDFTNQNGISGSFDNTTGVLTLSGTASVVDYQKALDSINYNSAASNPTASGTDTSRTVTWSVSDANGSSQPVTSTIDIQSATQPVPTLTALTASPDTGDITSGHSIAFTLDLSAAVTVSGGTPDLILNDGGTAAYDATASGATDLVFDYTVQSGQSTDALAVSTLDLNGASIAGAGGNADLSNVATSFPNLEVNAQTTTAPLSISGAGNTVTYTAGGAAITVDPTLSVSDSSATDLTGASVAISQGFLSGDTLDFTNQNDISGSFDAATGVLMLSGTASVADYQTALDSVTFSSAAADPTANGTDKSRTITWTASTNGNSAAATSTIDVSAGSSPNTGSLDIVLASGGSWTLDSPGTYSYDGTIDIGYDNGAPILTVAGGVTIEPSEIIFATDAVATAIISGQTIQLATGGFDMNFGGKSNPLSAADNFLAGLPLTITELQLTNNGIDATFNLSFGSLLGDAALENQSVTISSSGIEFGSTGTLEIPNIPSMDFFGLFTADLSDLGLSINSNGSELKISGTANVTADVADGTASLNLDFNGPDSYIAISDNNGAPSVQFNGPLEATGNFVVSEGWTLADMSLAIDPTNHSISGSGSLLLPFGFGVDATVDLVTNPLELQSVGAGVYSIDTPILDTGLFLTGIAGDLGNLLSGETPYLEGTFDISVGPVAELSSGLTVDVSNFVASGTLDWGQAFQTNVSGDFGAIDSSTFGSIELATFTGSTTLNWPITSLSANVSVNVLDGLFTGSASFTENQYGFTAIADGSIQIPQTISLFGDNISIPFISGMTLASGGFEINYNAADPTDASDFIEVWGTLAGFIIAGIKVDFNGSWEFVNSQPLAATSGTTAQAALASPTHPGSSAAFSPQAALSAGSSVSSTYSLPSGLQALVLTAAWSNAGVTPTLSVVEPNGTIVQQSDFARSGISDIPSLDTSTSQSLAVMAPQAGNWQLVVSNEAETGPVTFSADAVSNAATLSVATPVAESSGAWAFNWTASNLPSNATITFYATTSGSDFNGVPISTPMAITGDSGQFIWNGTGVAPGSYHVYAEIDGSNSIPADAFAAGQSVAVDAEANLAVTLTGTSGLLPSSGNPLVLEVQVVNAGPATADNAVALLQVPSDFSVVPNQPNIVQDGNEWQINLGNISSGGTIAAHVTLTSEVTPNNSSATFSVNVDSDTFDSTPKASSASLSIGNGSATLNAGNGTIDFDGTIIAASSLTGPMDISPGGSLNDDGHSATMGVPVIFSGNGTISAVSGTTLALDGAVTSVGTLALDGTVDMPDFSNSGTIYAESGADTIGAMAKNIWVSASPSAALTFLGDMGAATVFGNGGGLFEGGAGGGNVLVANGGASTILGSTGGDDTLVGAQGTAMIAATPNDLVFAASNGGEDTVFGTASGSDTLVGGDGAATLVGSTGNDEMWGGTGRDILFGGTGNETLGGGTGNATVVAGTGASTLVGGSGNQEFVGAASGEATAFSGVGNATLFTGGETMTVVLQNPSTTPDIVVLQSGHATIWGASRGTDIYDVIKGTAGGQDLIMGFKPGQDMLNLYGYQTGAAQLSSSAGNAALALPDGTIITFAGISQSHLAASIHYG